MTRGIEGILCFPATVHPAGEKEKDVPVRIDVKSVWDCSGSGAVAARGQPGYTLVEVIVGMWLLMVVVVSLFGAFSFGFSTIRISQEDVRASQILLQKLETLRVYDWSRITNGYFPTNFTADYSDSGDVTYDGTIAIEPFPTAESYSNTLRQVTVSLSWVSSGVPRYRVATTFVSQNGIQTYKQ